MPVRRAFPTILSDRLPETRDFYVALLGFEVGYDSDWFVSLLSRDPDDPDAAVYELGIQQVGHELVPQPYRADPAGVVLTFVVDDVDAVHAEARRCHLPVVAPPREEFYGQRRMLVTDPNGLLVDVSTPSTPSPDFIAELERRGLAPETTG